MRFTVAFSRRYPIALASPPPTTSRSPRTFWAVAGELTRWGGHVLS
ncbi:hypothetical protein ACPA9J_33105 [Pseudomonas aeruginosa]